VPLHPGAAALAAPALAKLGVPLIVSQLFAFYDGIMAGLSPSVALAALAAAPIARGNPDKDRLGGDADRARRLRHSLHLPVFAGADVADGRPDGLEVGGAVAFATFKALVAIGLFGIIAIGFLSTRLTLVERAVATAAALCLLGDFLFSDTIGFALAVALGLRQWRQRPRDAVAAA
jgi:TRAP-type uncharacterized transport system fused permease subunit